MEPYRLRRWRRQTSPDRLAFFTCARPGRSKSDRAPVSDEIVDKWARGLPGDATRTTIVSLLGRKRTASGVSEFSFYSFCGGLDTPGESRGRPTFQQWLDRRHAGRGIHVIEHPTIDFCPVPPETLEALRIDIERLLSEGRTVVLVDSGGETRTKAVCRHLGFVEDSRRQ